MAEAARTLRCSFLLVGVSSKDCQRLREGGNLFAVAHACLSRLAQYAELIIHHGGIGTMYAALNASVPSLVHPHAFDQLYNCHLLERLDVGRRLPTDPKDWPSGIMEILEDQNIMERVELLSSRLVPANRAATSIARELTK